MYMESETDVFIQLHIFETAERFIIELERRLNINPPGILNCLETKCGNKRLLILTRILIWRQIHFLSELGVKILFTVEMIRTVFSYIKYICHVNKIHLYQMFKIY